MNHLNIKTKEGFSIYIPLFCFNTVLLGDSGTGKSYIYNSLKELSSSRKLKFKCACFDPDNCTTLLDILNTDYDGLIVIEDFDILLLRFPELKMLLNAQRNTVLLIGRQVTGIYTHIWYIFDVVTSDKRIGVIPTLGDKAWYEGEYKI